MKNNDALKISLCCSAMYPCRTPKRRNLYMIRLLLYILYGFRFIYWAFLEFFSAFGKKLKVQGSVESVTSQPGPMGLAQVRVRYKYTVQGRTYSGSFVRECSQRITGLLLQRFPLGGMVWIQVDENHPQRSYLPSGLGYTGPLLAIAPLTALAVLWLWWAHIILTRNDKPAKPPVAAATCPAGLPGTPESATGSTDRKTRKKLVTFKSKEGEFSALVPLLPQHLLMESSPTPYGPLEFHRSTAETPDALYEVTYGDVPGNGPIDTAAWLNSTGNSRLQNSALIERHDIKLDGIPGSAYTAADDRY
jgi:hypothetical protein